MGRFFWWLMTNDLSSFLNVRMQILMSFIILLQNNNKNTNRYKQSIFKIIIILVNLKGYLFDLNFNIPYD